MCWKIKYFHIAKEGYTSDKNMIHVVFEIIAQKEININKLIKMSFIYISYSQKVIYCNNVV